MLRHHPKKSWIVIVNPRKSRSYEDRLAGLVCVSYAEAN
jgi:hypothetical protein